MPPKKKTAATRKVNQNLIKVSERDALMEDPSIKGQNYALVSFLEPTDILKSKETFMLEHFMKSILGDLGDVMKFLENKYTEDKGIFTTIKERYNYLIKNDLHEQFVYFKKNADDLEDTYYKQNDFQPTRRGFKIRGVYDSIPECQAKCKQLRVIDPQHNIHILQTGTWCIFNPNEDDIEHQEYAYDELNTLMHKYNTNRRDAQEFYDERKNELIEENKKDNIEKKKRIDAENAKVNLIEDSEETGETGGTDKTDGTDKTGGTDKTENTGDNEIIGSNKVIEPNEKVEVPTAELMSGLEGDDPWLQRKKEQ